MYPHAILSWGMDSRDGLPLGALPSGILKIEKYCPGLKVPVSRNSTYLFIDIYWYDIILNSDSFVLISGEVVKKLLNGFMRIHRVLLLLDGLNGQNALLNVKKPR